MMVAAMETIFGTEAGLTQAPGFMQSARFMQFMTTPTGKAFNFSDSGSQASINNMQYWFAAKQNDPTLLWLEEQALRKLPSDFAENISKRFITHRLLPSMLVFRAMSDFKTIGQPKSNFWINRGIQSYFCLPQWMGFAQRCLSRHKRGDCQYFACAHGCRNLHLRKRRCAVVH